MDKFEESGLPLTVGIIGNYFGKDDKIVSYVKEGAAAGHIEVSNHAGTMKSSRSTARASSLT